MKGDVKKKLLLGRRPLNISMAASPFNSVVTRIFANGLLRYPNLIYSESSRSVLWFRDDHYFSVLLDPAWLEHCRW